MQLAHPADADTYLSPLQRAERQIADELAEQQHQRPDAALKAVGLSPLQALYEFEYLTGLAQTSIYKGDAIRLLGGTVTSTAASLGITPASVSQWPGRLPFRIVDRIHAALARRAGVSVSGSPIAPIQRASTWSVNAAPPARSFLSCLPVDDAFVVRACCWAAAALAVMALAGMLP